MPQTAWPSPGVTGVPRPRRRAPQRAPGPRRATAGSIGRDGLLPVALPPLPTAAVRRGARPGPRHQGAAQRRARRPGRPRLPVQRAAGHGQDVDRPHPRQGPQLRGARSTASRAAKCENCVAVAEGRVIDWLLEQDAASKSKVDDMRDLLERVPLGTLGQPQGDHPRRGPHAQPGRRERPAQDARGTARPRRVRAGHHRPAEGAAHDPQPHPALRVPAAAARRPRPTTCATSSPTPTSGSTTPPSTTRSTT